VDLCELGYDDLSLSFGLIHAVIKKKIFFLYVVYCLSLFYVVLSETLCNVLLLLSGPGHSCKGDFFLNLNEAFPG